MSRYSESPEETWSVEVATEHGFPYTFPFEFDRDIERNVVKQSETFTTPVSKTGRYGAQP